MIIYELQAWTFYKVSPDVDKFEGMTSELKAEHIRDCHYENLKRRESTDYIHKELWSTQEGAIAVMRKISKPFPLINDYIGFDRHIKCQIIETLVNE